MNSLIQYVHILLELFVSVQHIFVNTESIKPEAALTVPGQPPPDWPKSGSISFSGITMRYRESTPLILKGINIEIRAGEKIGIVGRSGCGKSTLGIVLFRIVEPEEGTILIEE